MKIAFVYQDDFPWDVRVKKIVQTLISEGNDVHLLCRNRECLPKYEKKWGIHIHRLPRWPNHLRIEGFTCFPAFFNPLWLYHLMKHVTEKQVDLIFVRDLPLALTAILAGKAIGKPVILDMAEPYPEFLRCGWTLDPDGRPHLLRKPQDLLVRNPFFAEVVEKITLNYVDHVLVVAEESFHRLVKLGFPSEKITLVGNTPPLGVLDGLDEKRIRRTGSLRILYSGLLGSARDMETVFHGIKLFVEQESDDILLTIAGKGEQYQYILNIIHDWNLEKHVKLIGWVPHNELMEIIASHDVGLIPHVNCSFTNNTLPNKLFDYMAKGIPVLASNPVPIARILLQSNCGLIYDSPETFRDCLIQLKDERLRYSLGQNGVSAIKTTYNWEADADRLLDSVFKLTKTKDFVC